MGPDTRRGETQPACTSEERCLVAREEHSVGMKADGRLAMSARNLTARILALIAFLLLHSQLISCGGGGGSGTESGGSSVPPANVAGSWFWAVEITGASSPCQEAIGEAVTGEMTIVQNGTLISVIDDDGDEATGTITGNVVEIHWEGSVDGVWGTEDYSLTVSDDESSMIGTVDVFADNGEVSCSATGTVNAFRISPLVIDDGPHPLLVISRTDHGSVMLLVCPLGEPLSSAIALATLQPGEVAAITLPPGSWRVFTAQPDDAALYFEVVGALTVTTPESSTVSASESERRGGFLFAPKILCCE